MSSLRGSAPAPEFPGRLEWLNVDRPVRLAELRGRVVLLEFWTFCCVNCHHNLAEVGRLRARFGERLVVLGVHSAKFPAEKLSANIREAVERHGIVGPVLNDSGLEVWQRYAVAAWPTVVLIDPAGHYVGSQSGEIRADELGALIEAMLGEFSRTGETVDAPLPFTLGVAPATTPLRHPTKVLAVDDGRLFVADTGHHRVVELAVAPDAPVAQVRRIFGAARPGLADGAAHAAAFTRPHGLALVDRTLYVADTGNHAVRAVDLASGQVRTVAGTGELGRGRPRLDAPPTEIALRSPWALLAHEEALFIAMAGSHQIWTLAAGTQLAPFVGSGHEALQDGPAMQAGFNQPSDLALAMGHLFVLDAEASAVRAVSLLGGEPQVHTLVGQGLFDWGDVDGEGARVRLQHPLGLASRGDRLFIADSYNHKIKELDPTSGRMTSLVGSGFAGRADGALLRAQFHEPTGLSWAAGRLFVADTNNHAVRVVDVDRRTVATLEIEGLEAP
jgi:hypothetical protein